MLTARYRQFASGSRQTPDPFDQFLDQEGFYRKHTARDSSCLFRCVSEQLFGTQQYHEFIREMCVNYMMKRRKFLQKDINFHIDDYLNALIKPKCYGSLFELRELGYLYQRNVVVFEAFNMGTWLVHEPEFIDCFRIFYTPEKHFDSVFTKGYIEDAAFCQSICYEILYKNVFKLPDVTYAVERMLHDPIDYMVDTRLIRSQINDYYEYIELSDGRDFKLDGPMDTACILDDYQLCHFHNPSFEYLHTTLQRDLHESNLSHDLPRIRRMLDSLLSDKYLSCVIQLLNEGITPFPYKVAKALDPDIYRNIEFDMWSDSRKENLMRNWYYGGESLLPGVKCLVRLNPSQQILYNCHIQEMCDDKKGPCVVFIEELGEKRTVPYAYLKPLPKEEIKLWSIPYRVHRYKNVLNNLNAIRSNGINGTSPPMDMPLESTNKRLPFNSSVTKGQQQQQQPSLSSSSPTSSSTLSPQLQSPQSTYHYNKYQQSGTVYFTNEYEPLDDGDDTADMCELKKFTSMYHFQRTEPYEYITMPIMIDGNNGVGGTGGANGNNGVGGTGGTPPTSKPQRSASNNTPNNVTNTLNKNNTPNKSLSNNNTNNVEPTTSSTKILNKSNDIKPHPLNSSNPITVYEDHEYDYGNNSKIENYNFGGTVFNGNNQQSLPTAMGQCYISTPYPYGEQIYTYDQPPPSVQPIPLTSIPPPTLTPIPGGVVGAPPNGGTLIPTFHNVQLYNTYGGLPPPLPPPVAGTTALTTMPPPTLLQQQQQPPPPPPPSSTNGSMNPHSQTLMPSFHTTQTVPASHMYSAGYFLNSTNGMMSKLYVLRKDLLHSINPVNFDATPSYSQNGNDLPLHDNPTLRFFYNLGIDFGKQYQYQYGRNAFTSLTLLQPTATPPQLSQPPSNHCDGAVDQKPTPEKIPGDSKELNPIVDFQRTTIKYENKENIQHIKNGTENGQRRFTYSRYCRNAKIPPNRNNKMYNNNGIGTNSNTNYNNCNNTNNNINGNGNTNKESNSSNNNYTPYKNNITKDNHNNNNNNNQYQQATSSGNNNNNNNTANEKDLSPDNSKMYQQQISSTSSNINNNNNVNASVGNTTIGNDYTQQNTIGGGGSSSSCTPTEFQHFNGGATIPLATAGPPPPPPPPFSHFVPYYTIDGNANGEQPPLAMPPPMFLSSAMPPPQPMGFAYSMYPPTGYPQYSANGASVTNGLSTFAPMLPPLSQPPPPPPPSSSSSSNQLDGGGGGTSMNVSGGECGTDPNGYPYMNIHPGALMYTTAQPIQGPPQGFWYQPPQSPAFIPSMAIHSPQQQQPPPLLLPSTPPVPTVLTTTSSSPQQTLSSTSSSSSTTISVCSFAKQQIQQSPAATSITYVSSIMELPELSPPVTAVESPIIKYHSTNPFH